MKGIKKVLELGTMMMCIWLFFRLRRHLCTG
jgi:hypothetical protein